jgi:glycosyltransferase involved in cell wall biosynthesis
VSAPTVSIVLPFFNAEHFLHETLDSVFAQTFTNWELLLVDDGSTDASTDIARQCERQRPDRVFYLEHAAHANRGLAESRNFGIASGRADWIALLDADDVWRPEKLERQLELARRYPSAQLVFGRAEYWHSWNGGADAVPDVQSLSGLYHAPRLMLLTILGDIAPPPPSDVLVRRRLWQQVGGFEPDVPALYEDQVYLAKCFATASAYVANETWTRYRRHEASMEARAGSIPDAAYSDRIRFLRWLDSTFSYHQDATLRATVKRFTWPARNPHLHRTLWRARRALHRF